MPAGAPESLSARPSPFGRASCIQTYDFAVMPLAVALEGELVGIVDNDAIVNVNGVPREVLLV